MVSSLAEKKQTKKKLKTVKAIFKGVTGIARGLLSIVLFIVGNPILFSILALVVIFVFIATIGGLTDYDKLKTRGINFSGINFDSGGYTNSLMYGFSLDSYGFAVPNMGETATLYTRVAQEVGISRSLLIGTHATETTLRTESSSIGGPVSYTGARGVFQFQPSTWASGGYIIYTGQDAEEKRRQLNLGSHPGKKFEDVTDWELFTTIGGGRGKDYDGDGKADPRSFADSIYSSALMLKSLRDEITAEFNISDAIADYCSYRRYNGKSDWKNTLKVDIAFLQWVEREKGTIYLFNEPMNNGANNLKLNNLLKNLINEYNAQGGNLTKIEEGMYAGWRTVNYGKYYDRTFDVSMGFSSQTEYTNKQFTEVVPAEVAEYITKMSNEYIYEGKYLLFAQDAITLMERLPFNNKSFIENKVVYRLGGRLKDVVPPPSLFVNSYNGTKITVDAAGPYRAGGIAVYEDVGVDCGGLVSWILRAIGGPKDKIPLHYTGNFEPIFEGVYWENLTVDQLRPGDILLSYSHIGIIKDIDYTNKKVYTYEASSSRNYQCIKTYSGVPNFKKGDSTMRVGRIKFITFAEQLLIDGKITKDTYNRLHAEKTLGG